MEFRYLRYGLSHRHDRRCFSLQTIYSVRSLRASFSFARGKIHTLYLREGREGGSRTLSTRLCVRLQTFPEILSNHDTEKCWARRVREKVERTFVASPAACLFHQHPLDGLLPLRTRATTKHIPFSPLLRPDERNIEMKAVFPRIDFCFGILVNKDTCISCGYKKISESSNNNFWVKFCPSQPVNLEIEKSYFRSNQILQCRLSLRAG